ncbi:MAG: zf-HC2 domain-containing protein [Thermomicrobiales bacterium]|nr:zf-HC2 domain-containing protein [Thermomicrobiales bacterium]
MPAGEHASDEQLNALIDGALSVDELEAVERHVAGCLVCQAHVGELRGVVAMVRSLPEPRLRRSFQLGPEHQRAGSPWTRLAALLLPALPALRATTVAVALLLAGVSIRNVTNDPADDGLQSDIPVAIVATSPAEPPTESAERNTAELQTNQQPVMTTAESAPVIEAGLDEPEEATNDVFASEPADGTFAFEEAEADDESAGSSSLEAPAPEAAEDAAADSELAQPAAKLPPGGSSGSAPADAIGGGEADEEIADTSNGGTGSAAGDTSADENIAMAALAPESPTVAATPTATHTATATPTSTATPSPSPSPTPTPTPAVDDTRESTSSAGRDGWEVLQLGLAIALIVLIAIVIAAGQIRSRQDRSAS